MTSKILIIKKEAKMGKSMKIKKTLTRQMVNFNDLQLALTTKWPNFCKTRYNSFMTN